MRKILDTTEEGFRQATDGNINLRAAIEKNSFVDSVQFAFFRNLVLFGISAFLFSTTLATSETEE